ncbi:MAG: hypothetical protein AMS18_05415 [Gemmatimonas sp. SG8_17]|nr:MAG: hypothetical protein AMS18_05415 [Gemmatimonas sp. SG8_17]
MVTASVADAISALGGFVLDSKRFSNKALTLRIEIPASGAADLASAMADCWVTLDDASVLTLEHYGNADSGALTEVTGTLHLRFIHEEPELRIETPAVPG